MKEALLLQFVAAAASMLFAGGADTIGAVNIAGDFRLNGQPAAAHATLLSGVTLKTQAAFGEISLAGGVHVLMAAGSEAQLYRDRLILQRGAVQLEHAGDYVVEAQGLRISPDGNASTSVNSTPRGIQVATVSGRARVVNAAGDASWVSAGKVFRCEGISTLGNARRGPSPSRPSRPTPPWPSPNPFPARPRPFRPPLSP